MQQWLKKIEEWGLLLFLAIFSFQTRIVIARWAPLSFGPFMVGSIRPFSEWMSGFIYASDILFLVLRGMWLLRRKLRWWRKEDWWLVALLCIASISIIHAINIPVALFRTLKLAEYVLLFWYMRDAVSSRTIAWRYAGIAVIAGALVQAFIAIVQSVLGHSLGLHILGESPLSLSTSNVAVFIADGTKYLRAYGVMPHPNVLAVLLYAVALILVAVIVYELYPQVVARRIAWVSYVIILWALFLTYARTILAVWLLVMSIVGVYIWVRRDEIAQRYFIQVRRIWMLTFIIGLVFVASHWVQVQSRVHIDPQEEAVTQRVFYDKVAGRATVTKPLFGLGMGQFVPNLAFKYPNYPLSLYQPAHNIYLLISSELGIIGLIVFSGFIIQMMWRYSKKVRNDGQVYQWIFFSGTLGILAMGLLDHFLWTLQQGSMLMWIIFAIMAV